MTHVILMSLVFRHNCHVPVPTVSQLRQVWSNYHLRTFERKILDEYMFYVASRNIVHSEIRWLVFVAILQF